MLCVYIVVYLKKLHDYDKNLETNLRIIFPSGKLIASDVICKEDYTIWMSHGIKSMLNAFSNIWESEDRLLY